MNGFYFMLIKIHGISHTRVVPHFIKSIVKFQNPSCEVTGSINFTLFSSAPLPHNVARFWEMHIVAISYLKAFGALDLFLAWYLQYWGPQTSPLHSHTWGMGNSVRLFMVYLPKCTLFDYQKILHGAKIRGIPVPFVILFTLLLFYPLDQQIFIYNGI